MFSNFAIEYLEVLTATVNTTTGEIVFVNNSASELEFDYYQLTSLSGSLDPDSWNSLDAQDFDATGGGVGESWDEAGGSNASALGELYLQDSSVLGSHASVSIGNAYDTSVDGQDIVFNYRLQQFEYTGEIEYISSPVLGADFDEDGDIDGGDFLAWQVGFGMTDGATHGDGDADDNGAVDGADLDIWESQFGSGSGGLGSGTAVPEPGTVGLIVLMLAGFFCHRAGWRNIS